MPNLKTGYHSVRISSYWSAWLAGPLENPQATHRKAGIDKVPYPRYSMLNFRGVKLKSTERARLMLQPTPRPRGRTQWCNAARRRRNRP